MGPELVGTDQKTARTLSEPFERDAHGKPVISLRPESVFLFGTLIRTLERTLLDLFTEGVLSGTTHTCIGQELCQMSVVRALHDPHDAIVSNHRNHGHFLTYSGQFLELIAEIMGRDAGVCGGVGGSQHLAFRNFHSNGVQAGMTANAVGQALSRKKRGQTGITAVIVGDGTLGEGLLYESMNLASIWQVPALFVVENNRIAQTTPTEATVGGGNIRARGDAFGLTTWKFDDADPDFLRNVEGVVEETRASGRPGLLVIDTMRLGPHSKGDDARPEAEMNAIRERDPLTAVGNTLSARVREELQDLAQAYVAEAREKARQSPESRCYACSKSLFSTGQAPSVPYTPHQGNVRASLNEALRGMLASDPDLVILGEDLHEPYGGAFKVTNGLSSKYPDRVISTPISEAAITGAGIGLALAGWKPVVEIMFADFITLTLDQLYNHAVKFPGMFPEAQVPLVIRTPSGGRRGYGPTHSQCPESLACAVPGLTVIFPSHRHFSGSLLRRAVVDWPYPTVFFEHKLTYGLAEDQGEYEIVAADPEDPGAELFPLLRKGPAESDVTMIAYGHALTLAESVADRMKSEELQCEILTPSLLSPLPVRTIARALRGRDKVVIIEEAPTAHGWGAELIAALIEQGFAGSIRRVGAPPVPIPAARSLEQMVLPQPESVINAIMELLLL